MATDPSPATISVDTTNDHQDLLSDGTKAETPAGDGQGDDLLQRVVQGAHAGIDRLAESAGPKLQRLQEGVNAASDVVRTKTAEAREAGEEWVESLRCSVRQRPLTAIAAAAALGVLVARLSR